VEETHLQRAGLRSVLFNLRNCSNTKCFLLTNHRLQWRAKRC